MFLRVQLTITQHWLDNGLVPSRRQAIIWTNNEPIHWRIYAALVGEELMDSDDLFTHIFQSCDCPSASKVTPVDIGKSTITKQPIKIKNDV